jgi:hypothetical protein
MFTLDSRDTDTMQTTSETNKRLNVIHLLSTEPPSKQSHQTLMTGLCMSYTLGRLPTPSEVVSHQSCAPITDSMGHTAVPTLRR